MSFVTGMVLSNDCSNNQIGQFREIYGISLEEINSPSIRCQLENKQKFYMFNENIYFWDNWTPVGAKEFLKLNNLVKKSDGIYPDVMVLQEFEFNKRYISFEAQMYIIIIRYLKIVCKIQDVGIVGFMRNGSIDTFKFPVFNKKTVQVQDLNPDMLYGMEENCIYYFN